MYRQGTEADWTFLDSFKLHAQEYPGHCHVATLGPGDPHAESHAGSFANTYCLTTMIEIALLCPPFLHANPLKDVKNITHVLNYDYPNNSEDYVHRIGRTGRAGTTGTAITLFTTESMLTTLPTFLDYCLTPFS